MPIVFVHGVNNRVGEGYKQEEAARNGFLREIVAPALGLPSSQLKIFSPYWGGDGVSFAWNMACLPQSTQNFEAFGGGDEALGTTIELVASSHVTGGVVVNARRDFAGTVDLIYAAALAATTSEEEARDIAASYLRAAAYAEAFSNAGTKPPWLDIVEDENFVDVLNYNVNLGPGEAFGSPGGLLDTLKEGLSRVIQAIPVAASAELVGTFRKKLNATVTRFAGDAFVYLKNRGEPGALGPIESTVHTALRDAHAAKAGADDKLIVIAHSFGGEIMYDILTRLDPTLPVDCLITVGSQVGLFEEMKLYLASDAAIPPNAPTGKVARPTSLKRWLNVFDTNDVLSFRVEPIFADTHDFAYDTGYNPIQAHGGYFQRPSFYRRLAARLAE